MEWWFSYSVSDIWDYIKYIIKKHETLTAIPPIHFCTNRIYDKLLLQTKDGHRLELRTSETMKLYINRLLASSFKNIKKYHTRNSFDQYCMHQ